MQLDLGCVFDKENSVLIRNELSQSVQERCFAGAGPAADEDVLPVLNVSLQPSGNLGIGVSPGIGKLFRPHVREQVPMYRIGGSILRKPLSFSLGHGRTIEKPFFRKAAFLKHLFELAELL